MLTGPNGLKYDIQFDDETGDVILKLPHSNGRMTELRFDNVRDVLEFIGQKKQTNRLVSGS
jgi:hypothetical protein